MLKIFTIITFDYNLCLSLNTQTMTSLKKKHLFYLLDFKMGISTQLLYVYARKENYKNKRCFRLGKVVGGGGGD